MGEKKLIASSQQSGIKETQIITLTIQFSTKTSSNYVYLFISSIQKLFYLMVEFPDGWGTSVKNSGEENKINIDIICKEYREKSLNKTSREETMSQTVAGCTRDLKNIYLKMFSRWLSTLTVHLVCYPSHSMQTLNTSCSFLHLTVIMKKWFWQILNCFKWMKMNQDELHKKGSNLLKMTPSVKNYLGIH